MGGGEREGRNPPPEASLGDRGFGPHRVEVRGEHALDLWSADPPFQTLDGSAILKQDERRDLCDAEEVDPLGRAAHLDARDTQVSAFLPGEMGEKAFHPPRRARGLPGEEEQRGGVLGQATSVLLVLEGIPCA